MNSLGDVVSVFLRLGIPLLAVFGTVFFYWAYHLKSGTPEEQFAKFDFLMTSAFKCLSGAYILVLWALVRQLF